MNKKKYYLISFFILLLLCTPSVIEAQEIIDTPIMEEEPENQVIDSSLNIETVNEEPENTQSFHDFIAEEEFSTETEGLSNQELFEQYVNEKLGIENEPTVLLKSSRYTGVPLEGLNATLYELLSNSISQVASGEIENTVFSFNDSDLQIEDVYYTEEELGVSSFLDENGSLTEETHSAFNENIRFNLSILNKALLYNHPYDLYWYDKSFDGALRYSGSFSIGNGLHLNSMKLYMLVSADYSKTGETGTYDVDTEIGTSVSNTVDSVQSIVAEYSSYDDYDKLTAYKDVICDLASYNYDAANNEMNYGNPWQLIWVFDQDENTKVVCEGYAKAFDYLCSLSSFKNPDLQSYLVSGLMNDDQHMWNIVSFGFNNYLVDVTNCDSGTIGAPDKLFLAGFTTGNITDGYGIKTGNRTTMYSYDESTRLIYSEGQLLLSGTNYFNAVNDAKHSLSSQTTPEINFYFDFTDELLEKEAYVELTIDGSQTSIAIQDASIKSINEVDYHQFTTLVSSIQDTSTISVKVLLANGDCVYGETYTKEQFSDKGNDAYFDEFPFLDVAEDAWYYNVAKECYETGLISGTSATTFSPMQEMTRAMVVTILWRMEGSPSVTVNTEFSDVSSKQWYAAPIAWAKETGVVHGYGDGTFKPDAAVTREQLAAILANYAAYKGVYVPGTKKLNTYPDGNQVSDWAKSGMKWAITNGIISGNGAGYLNPKKSATRAEGAAMLLRMKNWLA